MEGIEIIQEEVERLLSELVTGNEGTMFEQGRISALEDMKLFINTIAESNCFMCMNYDGFGQCIEHGDNLLKYCRDYKKEE